MRLIRLGCLGLLVLLLVGYGVVVSLPLKRNAPQIEQALTAARGREEALKPRLKDPAQNGFLEPRLQPYWGRGWENAGPVKDALKAWLAYSYQAQGKPIAHHPLLVSKDPTYAAARAGFKAYVPDLVRAFSKPVFRPVVEDIDDPSARLQESAFTDLTLALNTYAESLVAEGTPRPAALVYQLGFMVGQKNFENAGLPQLMRGVSLQGLTFQSMAAYFGPGSKLTPGEWAQLSAAIAATCPTPITLEQAVQNDLAFGVAFLNRPRASYDGDARPLRGLFLLPGMRAREIRVFENFMAGVLAQASSMRVQAEPPAEGLSSTLTGASGPGLRLMAPNYRRQAARLTVHMAKMAGLSGMAAVSAYRAQHGKPPARLGELDQMGLRAPGGAPWSEVEKNVSYRVGGQRAELIVPVDPAVFEDAGLNPEAARLIEEANSLHFSIRPEGVVFTI